MGCKKALFRKSREWWRCRQGRGGRREGAARFPGIPNLGDVTKADWNEQEPVDVVVFGSPCQAFSVAGKRAGLDDPRGNLTLIGLGIVGRLRPRWFVWENVPGVLSLDGGRTFGTILGLMGELGYGFAYAVLDARWFGVPQRRRRVFVVGCLGDWRGPAAVLFERESLRGDSPPRREAGEGVARPIGSGSKGSSGYSNDADTAENLVAFAENSRAEVRLEGGDGQIAGSLKTGGGKPGQSYPAIAFMVKDYGGDAGEVAPTLRAGTHDKSHANAGVMPAVAVQESQMGCREYDTSGSLRANGPGHDPVGTRIRFGMRVRRLLPIECERLQGFPDDWTLIERRGKPAADGPRYRALGNAMAVPCIAWVLGRLAFVDSIINHKRAA